jgi:hypothetical protein
MDESLKKWACSFSGCDGGNANSDTWLCGIEWGGGSYEDGKYYKEDLPNEIKKGSVEADKKFDWKRSVTYRYGISFAKLYTAINGKDVANYTDVVKLTGNELFKLNLYPIAFDSTDHNLWQKYGLEKITGFQSKYLFNIWCLFNRFPFFAKIREDEKPKLIICTGINYLFDFLIFFGAKNIEKIQIDSIKPQSENNAYDRNYYWVKIDKTLLVVIPFFSGRYGLNSNYLLQQMGERIKNLLND